MTVSSVKRLSDDALRRDLRDSVAQNRITTVRLLLHLAEFDARRLYRADAYASMFAYCIGELGMSEDIAYKRIRAARAGRRFQRVFTGIADGSLTLSGVALLARYLTDRTAEELLESAERKTNDQIRQLLAERYPQPDLPTLVVPIESQVQLAVRPVLDVSSQPAMPVSEASPVLPTHVECFTAGSKPTWQPMVRPLAPERYGVQFTMTREDHELLERARELLGHQIPSGDESQVLLYALRVLVRQLEKRKLGAADKPSKAPAQESKNLRYVAARVRRAVQQRDGGRCTFVGDNGRRCEARKLLEFDHVLEIARGGRSTLDNLRLRCRAHNQLAAEQRFGEKFVEAKVDQARALRHAPPRNAFRQGVPPV